MKVGDIFVALGFDVDDKTLKGFDEGIGSLNTKMIATATAAAAAVYQIGAFVEKSIHGAAVLRDFKLQTGESIEKMQQWQTALPLADINSTAETATASIKNLQKQIYDVRWGQGNPQAFNLLGIDIMHGQDAFDALEQLRERMQQNIATFGRTKTVSLMQQMGLDPSFINALSLTREQFAELYKGRILNQEELDKLNAAGFAIKRLSTAWEYFTAKLSADASPIIVKTIEMILPHIENIFHGIEKIGTALSNNVPLVASLAAAFAPFIAMFSPWTAALAGVVFLLDKIGSAKPGDGSVWSTMVEGWGQLLGILKEVDKLLSKFYAYTLKKMADAADSPLGQATGRAFDEVVSALKDNTSALKGAALGAPPGTAMLMGGALGPAMAARGGTTVHKTQTNTFHVNGATDPQATAHAIQEGLRVQNSGAESYYNNGGW